MSLSSRKNCDPQAGRVSNPLLKLSEEAVSIKLPEMAGITVRKGVS